MKKNVNINIMKGAIILHLFSFKTPKNGEAVQG
jgi:hypothetical protein